MRGALAERRHRVSKKVGCGSFSRWDSGRRRVADGTAFVGRSALRKHQLGQPMVTYRPTEQRARLRANWRRPIRPFALRRPEVVWSTLHHAWSRQAGYIPGTAQRSITDELARRMATYARGWHNELAVTPDYETAALLLLLQRDMLAYVDETAAVPSVVIGAGITSAWLAQPMAVSNLAIPGGTITWQWDGHVMRVTLRGPSRHIRLGRRSCPHWCEADAQADGSLRTCPLPRFVISASP